MKKILTEHKGKLILSSLVTLLPIVFADRRNRENQSRKAIGLIFWVMPFVSLLTGGVTVMLERGVRSAGALSSLMALGFGLLFILLGNYMPKFRQNSFMGIRVKWTLENEANWNATRVAGGFACLAGALLPVQAMGVVFPAVLLVIVALPIAYSYHYDKVQPAAERTARPPVPPAQRWAARLIAAGVAVFAVWTLLMGSAEVQYGESSFTVAASGWEDLTVPYSDIAAVEYLPAEAVPDGGIRTYGLGNLRVGFGQFSNDAYGDYTRYTYRSCGDCVRLTTASGRTILLNGPDQAATRAIYETLRGQLEG